MLQPSPLSSADRPDRFSEVTRMQLGFMSALFPHRDLNFVLDTARTIGYESVELMCWPKGSGPCHLDVADLRPVTVAALHNQLEQTGISISALGYYPNPLSPHRHEHQEAVDQIFRLLDAAHQLGVPTVNTFLGRDPTKSIEDNWPRMIDVWGPIVDRAEQLQVRLGIENCPMFYAPEHWPGGLNMASTPAVWDRLFRTFTSPWLGLNFDPSHLIWLMIDPIAPIYQFGPRIFHVHAKDMRINRDRLNEVGIHGLGWYTAKLPGMGEVNWPRLISALGEIGYRGHIVVEVEDPAFEGTDEDRIRAVMQSYRYLHQYVS